MRNLAACAGQLAAAIEALHDGVRQGDALARTGFRLKDAAGQARQIADDHRIHHDRYHDEHQLAA
ncbi:hypothetical protein [Nonomuraea dietziae]|uniref:hypothetical protein n=1 Tax=Nonomuraea dietziae TaxID=65515 RepID=UPI003406C8B5